MLEAKPPLGAPSPMKCNRQEPAIQTHKSLSTAVGIGALARLAAGQASAHAALVKSDPAANATVAAREVISLTFNEALSPAFAGFGISMNDGIN